MGLTPDEWIAAHRKREELIVQEKEDPIRFGWEPPIWRVCDALLDMPWCDPDYAVAMREHLGFKRAVKALLINGGNRAGKSEYAAKCVLKVLLRTFEGRAWCFHSSNQNSVEYQHPLIWKFLPKELRQKIRSETTYISYNQKYGFSDSKVVLPNKAEIAFRNYEQDIRKIEGGECDIIWPDELVPPDWVDTMMFRIATREGRIIVTFTPVDGYTATVKLFQDGSEVMKEATAFMLPTDGGEPAVEQALVREDCDRWIEGETGLPEPPPDRKFERMPRVLRCFERDKAVVFFHTADNPYGNPQSVADKVEGRPAAWIRERWYGLADKTVTSQFPLFNVKIHVVAHPEDIPKDGTNFLFIDPASGRNFFMTWIRCTPEGAYVYREWPGADEVPGVGVPGPWAVPCGKKKDGKPGDGQKPFGFGLRQYKEEIARLEGWKERLAPKPEEMNRTEFVVSWSAEGGADEEIADRYLDSRFASAPKLQDDRPVTLITQFEDIGLFFLPTPGKDREEGISLINDLLFYDREAEVDFFNKPKLLVGAWCRNTIFALQNYTGQDGLKGACKDCVDNLRYFATSDAGYIEPGSFDSVGGGFY